MEQVLDQLVSRLSKALGDRLVSVVLYGSGASGDRQPRFSDFNVLCVLTQLTPQELRATEDTFRWWREQGSPSPLLLTEEEMANSTDSFAIEFHDIQQQHKLLHGRDVITSLVLDDSFYRAQVEHELRAKVLRLRQKAAGILSETNLLRRLLLDSVSTFCVLFRHALALHGHPTASNKREVIAMSGHHFGIATESFEKLLDVREERIKPREIDPVGLMGPYLAGINAVIEAVDRLEK